MGLNERLSRLERAQVQPCPACGQPTSRDLTTGWIPIALIQEAIRRVEAAERDANGGPA